MDSCLDIQAVSTIRSRIAVISTFRRTPAASRTQRTRRTSRLKVPLFLHHNPPSLVSDYQQLSPASYLDIIRTSYSVPPGNWTSPLATRLDRSTSTMGEDKGELLLDGSSA